MSVNFEKVGILITECFHERNVQGLKLMCKSKNIPIYYISSFEESLNHASPIIIISSNCLETFPLNKIPQDKFVIYGPNDFILPPDKPHWIGNIEPVNAVYNALCSYNVTIFNKYFPIKVPLIILPFAVDIDTYKPEKQIIDRPREYILYFKQRHPNDKRYFENIIEPLLKIRGYRKIEYIYGQYNEEDLTISLQKIQFAIIIGRHESQGFAIQQMMSCDIPLLVWDVTSLFQEYGTDYFNTNCTTLDLTFSTVPYWNEICGEKFTNQEDFIPSLHKFFSKLPTYNPRKFIVDTLSPEKCMVHLLNIYNNFNK
jgi:hypothetical protein